MGKLLKKAWSQLSGRLNKKLDDAADDEVLLDQALEHAQEEDARLSDHATEVIASEIQTGMQLERARTNLEKTRASAKQALIMQQEATDAGDTDRVAHLQHSIDVCGTKISVLRDEIGVLEATLANASAASTRAKAAVAQSAVSLQREVGRRQSLLNQLGQAKMAEQLNATMDAVNTPAGSERPSTDAIERKIEGRLAKAQGRAQLQGESVGSHMLEIEQAAQQAQARAEISSLRSELGQDVPSGTSAAEQAQDLIEAEIAAAVAAADKAEGRDEGQAAPA